MKHEKRANGGLGTSGEKEEEEREEQEEGHVERISEPDARPFSIARSSPRSWQPQQRRRSHTQTKGLVPAGRSENGPSLSRDAAEVGVDV